MEGMDRIIEKKKFGKKQLAIAGLLVLALGSLPLIITGRTSKLRIDRDKVSVGKVMLDKYQDFISVNGTVEPMTTVFLDAVESGRVERILLEEGTRVKEGDIIMEVSNYNLLLDISGNEADVSRAINDLKTARMSLENQSIQTRARMLELEYQLKKLEREINRNEELFAASLIAREDYESALELYEETRLQLELQEKKFISDSIYIVSRLGADESSIERMQNNLVLTRQRLDNLKIKAPVDGELASLNPEIGQVINYGTRIGTINVLDAYKMKADIDEHYITRISRGLRGEFTFAGGNHELEITKIYPEVRNGTFAVDMEFTGVVPEQIRIGQTARIRLELGETEDALLLPRGGFFQSTGGQWVYVMDASGSWADKRNIRLGRQNPDFYEVLEGLSAGEEVIISGYENFGNADRLILK